MLAKLLAVVIHEVRRELRALDQPDGAAPDDAPRYDPSSTTAATTERAETWDHDKRAGNGSLRVPAGRRRTEGR